MSPSPVPYGWEQSVLGSPIPPAHKSAQDVKFARIQSYPPCPRCGVPLRPGEPKLCIQDILDPR